MRSRSLDRTLNAIALITLALVGASPAQGSEPTPGRELRVCADPAALPLSDELGKGLENELAQLVAKKMGAHVTYTWWAERRGFVRNTLKANLCDVVMGMPTSSDAVKTTRPYYTSAFAVLARKDRALADLRSFDDPRWHSLRIGVSIVGEDYGNPPPVFALARRGIVDNVHGYAMAAERHRPTPSYVDALVAGGLDVAVVWGPVAGILAKRSGDALEAHLVDDRVDAGVPMSFAISLGVRKKDDALAAELDRVLVTQKKDVDALLDRFGVLRLQP